MTPAQALNTIRLYAVQGRLRIRRHAWDRMDERGAVLADIRHALTHASAACTLEEAPSKWRVQSEDTAGDAITCICAVESDVVVITVF